MPRHRPGKQHVIPPAAAALDTAPSTPLTVSPTRDQLVHGQVLLAAASVGMLAMGLVSLIDPDFTVSLFDVKLLGSDGQNEVRAVYGGYGIALGVFLGWLAYRPHGTIQTLLGPGAVVALAVGFVGMAFGRIIGLCVDRRIGVWPSVFFGVELVLTALLLAAKHVMY
jgi:Domain of unknown function (DUF4345)